MQTGETRDSPCRLAKQPWGARQVVQVLPLPLAKQVADHVGKAAGFTVLTGEMHGAGFAVLEKLSHFFLDVFCSCTTCTDLLII